MNTLSTGRVQFGILHLGRGKIGATLVNHQLTLACSIQQEYIISSDEPYPNYYKQAKALTEAKKTNERLKSVNAQVLQQVLRTRLSRFY